MSDKKAIKNFRKMVNETKKLAKDKEKRILKEAYMRGPGDFAPADDPYSGREKEYHATNIIGELVDIPSDETVGGTADEEVIVDVSGEITDPNDLKNSVMQFKAWKIAGKDSAGKPVKGEELDKKLVWNHLDWGKVVSQAAGLGGVDEGIVDKFKNYIGKGKRAKMGGTGSVSKPAAPGDAGLAKSAGQQPTTAQPASSPAAQQPSAKPDAREMETKAESFISYMKNFIMAVANQKDPHARVDGVREAYTPELSILGKLSASLAEFEKNLKQFVASDREEKSQVPDEVYEEDQLFESWKKRLIK